MSIKARITLWYTLLMVAVVAVSMGALITISRSVVQSDARDQLITVIDRNSTEVEYDDDVLDIDSDFDYYRGGVYAVVYSHEGRLLSGQVPSDFPVQVALTEGNPRLVENGNIKYYVYDVRITSERAPEIWVRGMASVDGTTGFVGTIVRYAAIALPIIVALAACGGYLIARRSLRSLEQVAATAAEISSGADLSRRIELGPGKDEVHRLAGTVDDMFERLERSFETEKQFTSDVSHELKTPLTVILAQCEFAQTHQLSPEEYVESIDVIGRQAERISATVTELLSFTRLEQGLEQAAFEPTDLSELVTMLCEDYVPNSERGIALHVDAGAGVRANADVTLYARIVSNLLDNAYRYGHEGGNIWVRLELEGIADGGLAVLSVSDDGPGIAPEHLDKVWRRFYQVDAARSSNRGTSMGLGLAMVRQIAVLHGGDAEVASELGRGTTFSVRIPALGTGVEPVSGASDLATELLDQTVELPEEEDQS